MFLPFVVLAAVVLAAFGFGLLIGWIWEIPTSPNKGNSADILSRLSYRVDELDREVSILKDRTKAEEPCDAKFSPMANSGTECMVCGWGIRDHARTGK